MTLPRILVIDDQYYWDETERSVFLERTNLAQIELSTTNEELDKLSQNGNIGGAVFCSGQKKSGDRLENSIDEIDKYLGKGWPSTEGWRWALVMLDMHFSSGTLKNGIPSGGSDDDAFGLKILDYIVDQYPDTDDKGRISGNSDMPVIVLSGVQGEVKARKKPQTNTKGAIRYVTKDELKEKTTSLMGDFLFENGLLEDDRKIIIGTSLALLKTLRQARSVAQKNRGNVLILGEPGSGKTLLAEYIHRHSLRAKGPFQLYPADPTAEKVQKTDLFGFWPGGFTSADFSQPGRAELAHKGTLFIDEVGNLTQDCQAALTTFVRPLSDGSRIVQRVGNYPTDTQRETKALASIVKGGRIDIKTSNIYVDVLLITATNAPINDNNYRKENGFRNDLYDRLTTEQNQPIYFPSISARKDDVQRLFMFFLE